MSVKPSNCPGCGAPLLASDDICPFCGEVLAGTAAPGRARRPEPPVPEPPAPTAEAVGTEPPPWEAKRAYGFWNALWLTWRDSVFRPVQFFRGLSPRTGLGPALGYAVLLAVVALVFNLYWALIEGTLATGQDEGALALGLGSFVMLIVWLVFVIPLYVGLLFALVALLHVSFVIVGAGRRGFEATFRAVAYASGPAAFAIFPFFGPLLGTVWGTVLLFIAVREVQRTSNGRAAVGFTLPLIALLALFFLLALLLSLLMAVADISHPA
ncbi:MAG: YIP1 family protein [Gemmatimonadota bacterium]|nr:MAG: YIP1 family protein [Gemmatimonadota bacterium]